MRDSKSKHLETFSAKTGELQLQGELPESIRTTQETYKPESTPPSNGAVRQLSLSSPRATSPIRPLAASGLQYPNCLPPNLERASKGGSCTRGFGLLPSLLPGRSPREKSSPFEGATGPSSVEVGWLYRRGGYQGSYSPHSRPCFCIAGTRRVLSSLSFPSHEAMAYDGKWDRPLHLISTPLGGI